MNLAEAYIKILQKAVYGVLQEHGFTTRKHLKARPSVQN